MRRLFTLAGLCLTATASLITSAAGAAGGSRIVTGTIDCPPEWVQGITTLTPAQHKTYSSWDTSPLPRWQVRIGAFDYYLVFDGKANLEKLAARLEKQLVQVRGRVEQRQFILVRAPDPKGGPVLCNAIMVTLPVIVVEYLTEVAFCGTEPRKLSLRTTVHYVGNSYFRMPDGSIAGTLVGYPYEGCYILLNGKQVRLQFAPEIHLVDLQHFNGKTFVLTGRLETRLARVRWDNPEDAYELVDVLVVESYRQE
jgi:hypothetical protein